MRHSSRRINAADGLLFSLALILSISLPSCLHQERIASPISTDLAGKCLYPDIELTNRDLSAEIRKLEKVLTGNPDAITLGKAYRRLASLYSSPKNPSPDYSRSYHLLKKLSDLDRDSAQSDLLQYWSSLLATINELQQKNSHLTKENSEIKGIIEQLKNLDMSIEEKRKLVK